MKQKITISFLLRNYVWCCIVLFFLFLNNYDAFALETVKLKLKWKHQFQFAGYYAAIEKNFYANAGLDVQLIEACEDNNGIVESVLKGDAEFGIVASDLVITRSKGKPVVALAAIFQHSPLIFLVKKNSGICHIHDFEGKSVMIEPHSEELEAYLKEAGVIVKHLTMCSHKFDPSLLIKGDIDAMSAYLSDEPFLIKKKNIPYVILRPSSYGIDFYGDILFTSEDQLRKDNNKVNSFLNASLKGWKYAFENVDEMIELIYTKYSTRHSRDHLKYEAEEMRKLIRPETIELGHMHKGRWKSIAETYAKFSMIPENFSLDGFIHKKKHSSFNQWRYMLFLGCIMIIVLVSITLAADFIIKFHHHFFKKNNNSEGETDDNAIRDKRDLLSSFFITLLTGLAYIEMILAVKGPIQTLGFTLDILLLIATFFFISTRFFIGNQLHLISKRFTGLPGQLWLYDIMVIILQSVVLILLGGAVCVDVNKEFPVGFIEIMILLYTIDVAWIISQKLMEIGGKIFKRDFIPKGWAFLNSALIVVVFISGFHFYELYTTEFLWFLFGINFVAFVFDVFLLDYFGVISLHKN